MGYVVFKVEKEKLGKAKKIMNDDLLSRQSLTMREAEALGEEGNHSFFMLEGSEDALEKAKGLFKDEEAGEPLGHDKGQEIHEKIKEEENSSMAGVGALFG